MTTRIGNVSISIEGATDFDRAFAEYRAAVDGAEHIHAWVGECWELVIADSIRAAAGLIGAAGTCAELGEGAHPAAVRERAQTFDAALDEMGDTVDRVRALRRIAVYAAELQAAARESGRTFDSELDAAFEELAARRPAPPSTSEE